MRSSWLVPVASRRLKVVVPDVGLTQDEAASVNSAADYAAGLGVHFEIAVGKD